MDRLNSHFLRPSPTRSRAVSGDGESALVVKLGVSPSLSRLLTGSHRYHPGIVQQAQGRSAETAVSPHYNNQSTIDIVSSGTPRTIRAYGRVALVVKLTINLDEVLCTTSSYQLKVTMCPGVEVGFH
jgi:hypothetical protein